MPPVLATWLTIAGVIFLMVREVRRGETSSPALWLPVMWLAITGSRFVSQWIDLDAGAGGNIYEGSFIDALYFGSLIAAGLVVLARRQLDLGAVMRANGWLVAFALYGLVSVLWADDMLIAGKRWIKTLGHPVMALIILSDPDPKAAIRSVLKRCAYVFLPVSVLFIKYLPQYGRGFDGWSGMPVNNGIGLTKNDLGYVCMVSGVIFAWSLVSLKRIADPKKRREEMVVCVAFLLMAVWLLRMSDSMTSLATMVVGISMMVAVGSRFVNKERFAVLFIAAVAVAWALEAAFDLYEVIVVMLGRNPTLTDRTLIWSEVLAMQERPLIGYGFESFWLGDRLYTLWAKWWWRPTQAHNGYIETYLNLGLIGVALLGALLLSTFWRISRQLQTDLEFARLRLGLLLAIVMFNYTEAGFKGVAFIWTVFHIIAMEMPVKHMPVRVRRPSFA